MEPIPEGNYVVPIPFGKDWPQIKGQTLNAIAELPGGLAMLPVLSKWLAAKSLSPSLRTAIDRYLAVPRIAALVELAQQQEADAKAVKRTSRDHAQSQRQFEYGR